MNYIKLSVLFYSNIFDWIVGFTQLDFYPHIAAPFLQKLSLKVFIEGHDMEFVVGNLLIEEQNLGRNTDVAIMNQEKGWRLFLCSNSRSRPLGIPIPPQCVSCGRIASSKWTQHPNNPFGLIITCQTCPHVYEKFGGLDDCYTKAILKGEDGWGIGLYWGSYIDIFPSGTEALSRGSQIEEVENHLKAVRCKEHYQRLQRRKAAGKSDGQSKD
jgi:hypothetical protein